MNVTYVKPTTRLLVPELRAMLRGDVIAPNDPDYDQTRAIIPGGFDRRPAAIVRPDDMSDVSRVVEFARESGLELAVRGGGHSMAGHSTTEGGIVLDLRSLKALEIDAQNRTASAQAGLTAGQYTAATAAYGLATGFGDTGSVGIGGITLGGGIGYLVRKYGLTIDDLLGAEMVTADGKLRHVDDEHDPDLFWAIRGGGGNFGIVTRFEFKLHEVDTVVGGMLVLPATPDVLTAFVAAAEAAPDELTTIANVMVAPPMPFLPSEHHGRLIVMAMMVYVGDVEAGNRAVAPFRELTTPIVDMVRPMPYPDIFPPSEGGSQQLSTIRTTFVDTFDRGLAETVLNYLEAGTAPVRAAQLRVLGGAMGRVPNDASAFAHRQRRMMVNVAAMDERPEAMPAHEAWAQEFAAALRQGVSSAYVNFLGNEGEARVREAYPPRTWDRLVAIKNRYDPTNLFRLNQNIPPTGREMERTTEQAA